MTDDVDTALEVIVSDLSRIRSQIETLDLPTNDVRQKLLDHLGLASTAALHLRFKTDDDDLIVLDG